jgi:hypothetical protein
MGETEREGRSAAGKVRTGLWGRGSLALDGASWRWVGSYHLVLFWPRKGSCGRLLWFVAKGRGDVGCALAVKREKEGLRESWRGREGRRNRRENLGKGEQRLV